MEALREQLSAQLDEARLLESMYSALGEFHVCSPAAMDAIESFVEGKDGATGEPLESLGRLSFSLRLSCAQPSRGEDEGSEGEEDTATGDSALVETHHHVIEASFSLPHSYPSADPPEVYLRSDTLTRDAQDLLNSDLKRYMQSTLAGNCGGGGAGGTGGEVCLLGVVDWIRENAGSYSPPTCAQPQSLLPDPSSKRATERQQQENATSGSRSPPSSKQFSRLWLYMHHIYSKTKRRNILSLAPELGLTGFCLPGKPGVVCVEGEEGNTQEFYSALRRWQWKSITCRCRESGEAGRGVDDQRRIQGFRELSFDTHCSGTHMNMGQFLEYLTSHKLEHVFKELFGVAGHHQR